MARLALCEINGLLKDLIDKLSGKDGDRCAKKLKLFLREPIIPVLRPWMAITLGNLQSPSAYRDALVTEDISMDECANQILDEVSVSKTKNLIELVVVSGRELGFCMNAHLAEIYANGLERGFKLCPSEIGPALRLAHKNQPMNEWLNVATKSLADADGSPKIFSVNSVIGVGKVLNGSSGRPESLWSPDCLWVFVR